MNSLLSAFSFLTVLPFAGKHGKMTGREVLFFPSVGAMYGGLVSAWALLGQMWGIPEKLIVWGMIAWPLLVSGFLHFDGWCDMWDAFFPLVEKERRLAILKDSRIGVFGCTGGVLLLLFRSSVYPFVLVNAPFVWIAWVLSRFSIVGMAFRATYPREEGSAHWLVGRVSFVSLLIVLFQVMGCVVLLVWLSSSLRPLFSFVGVLLVMGGLRWLSRKKIGGITGDVLGATAELTEVVAILPWMDWL